MTRGVVEIFTAVLLASTPAVLQVGGQRGLT